MRKSILTVAMGATLLWIGTAQASGTPAQKCESAKLKAVGKYTACRLNAAAKAVTTMGAPDYTKCDGKLTAAYMKAEAAGGCLTTGDVAQVQTRVQGDTAAVAAETSGTAPTALRRLPATGQTSASVANDDGSIKAGAALNYVDNGDGTISDVTTGLMWEKKVSLDGAADVANLNDADNCYPWRGSCTTGGAACGVDADCGANGPCSAGGDCTSSPGLTVYQWAGQLNVANFGGHNDWRVPNMKELQSIIDWAHVSPAVDVVFNGASCQRRACTDITSADCSCTQAYYYWSATTDAAFPSTAWGVHFSNGYADARNKASNDYVRAVRGGL